LGLVWTIVLRFQVSKGPNSQKDVGQVKRDIIDWFSAQTKNLPSLPSLPDAPKLSNNNNNSTTAKLGSLPDLPDVPQDDTSDSNTNTIDSIGEEGNDGNEISDTTSNTTTNNNVNNNSNNSNENNNESLKREDSMTGNIFGTKSAIDRLLINLINSLSPNAIKENQITVYYLFCSDIYSKL
jgi:hypothetical protein